MSAIASLDPSGIRKKSVGNFSSQGIMQEIIESAPILEFLSPFPPPQTSTSPDQQRVGENIKFSSAHDIYQKKRAQPWFSTGLVNLDNLLMIPEYNSFGVRLGETYELAGSFRTGKTQLAHQLSVAIQLPERYGGLEKQTFYIDTESTFSPSKLRLMVQNFENFYNIDLDQKQILGNIFCGKASTSYRQFELLGEILSKIERSAENVGLVVVDSLIRNFRAEYPGLEKLVSRQQSLNQFLSLLSKIATDYDIAVLVTNQVQSDIDGYFGQTTIPVGGHTLFHWANHRMFIRYGHQNQRVISILDSSEYPTLETSFEITDNGLTDQHHPDTKEIP